MRSEPLQEAVRKAGSVTALARALGVAPQAISQWGRVPAERVLAVEAATGVSRHDLRPDIYPRSPGPDPHSAPVIPPRPKPLPPAPAEAPLEPAEAA